MAKNNNEGLENPELTAEQKLAALEKENAALKEEISVATELNKELQAKAETKGPATELPSVKHKGKTVQFKIGKFQIGDDHHTAESASQDPDVIDLLIDRKSGVITVS